MKEDIGPVTQNSDDLWPNSRASVQFIDCYFSDLI